MPAANDLRRRMAIKYNGNAAIVLEVHHRTPGNLRAFVQAIIRYINTGKSADVRFSSTDKVELVEIERKQLEFSYKDRNGYYFIDPETYDTVALQENLIGDAKDYLVEKLPLQVLYAEGKPVQIELPASVNLKIIESPRLARRYCEQCYEARHARNWKKNQRSSLHQGRRNDQDRYSHRRVFGTGMTVVFWGTQAASLSISAACRDGATPQPSVVCQIWLFQIRRNPR